MKVNWNQSKVGQDRFDDLGLNESFRIASPQSRGAVYVKVIDNRTGDYGMLELATGKVFDPTTSPVEPVNVEVNVSAPRPNIYR